MVVVKLGQDAIVLTQDCGANGKVWVRQYEGFREEHDFPGGRRINYEVWVETPTTKTMRIETSHHDGSAFNSGKEPELIIRAVTVTDDDALVAVWLDRRTKIYDVNVIPPNASGSDPERQRIAAAAPFYFSNLLGAKADNPRPKVTISGKLFDASLKISLTDPTTHAVSAWILGYAGPGARRFGAAYGWAPEGVDMDAASTRPTTAPSTGG